MPQQKKYDSGAQRQKAYRRREVEARLLQLAAKGLPPLPPIPAIPGEKRWQAGLLQSCHLLETIHDEMESYYDDRSEQWQESERGEMFEERIQMMEQLIENTQKMIAC